MLDFDKGVLHLTIKKPAKAIKTTKTIEIKTSTGAARGRPLNPEQIAATMNRDRS